MGCPWPNVTVLSIDVFGFSLNPKVVAHEDLAIPTVSNCCRCRFLSPGVQIDSVAVQKEFLVRVWPLLVQSVLSLLHRVRSTCIEEVNVIATVPW